MSFMFKRAIRENVNVLVGVAGGTGSGKTMSALRMARGLAGPTGRVFVIDTEARRALHYVGETPPGGSKIEFEHGELSAPFTPARYLEAISAAEKAGAAVIVIDSSSHEHAGDGGLLDMQTEELKKLGGGENIKMLSWVKPKMEHKRFMTRLLQCRAHLVFCFRAEEKIEIGKDANGKTVVKPKESVVGLNGWLPVCEKSMPYELTVSFLLTADKPGLPKPIKLPEQFKPFFPLGQPISEKCGEMLAAWAAGGVQAENPHNKTAALAAAPGPSEIGPTKTWEGAIKAVTQNTKTRRFAIETADGKAIKTDSEAVAKSAKGFASTGEVVVLTLDEAGWAIEPADQPPDEAEA